jgi:hypothetical protein
MNTSPTSIAAFRRSVRRTSERDRGPGDAPTNSRRTVLPTRGVRQGTRCDPRDNDARSGRPNTPRCDPEICLGIKYFAF